MSIITEEDLRSRLLVPYLQALGYGPHNIRLEQRFELRLGRTVVEVNGGRERDRIGGRLDLLVVNDSGQSLFVVEAKAPDQSLTDEDRDQGISYARLMHPIAPFVLLTNSRETHLYDAITKERLSQQTFQDESQFWRSGELTATEDLRVRYEALRSFLGYSAAHVRAFSDAQQAERMRALRSAVGEAPKLLAKYLPEVYVQRPLVRAALARFIESPSVTFGLIGESGVGKTNEMCALAEWIGEEHLCLFFNGAEVFPSLTSTLADEFNWHFSEHLPLPQIAERLAGIAQHSGCRVLIFIDALDEIGTTGVEREVSELAARLARHGGKIKLVVSAKAEEWPRFASLRGSPSPLVLSLYPLESAAPATDSKKPDEPNPQPFVLQRMGAEELSQAAGLYASHFRLPGEPKGVLREHCRLPFILRVLSEVYAGVAGALPDDIGEQELMRRFLEVLFSRMSDPERARRELDAVARALVERSREPVARDETIVKSQSVSEARVREVARLPATELVGQELVVYGLLERRRDRDNRTQLRFYFGRMRDYVIARWILNLDALSAEEFECQLPNLLSHRILEDAVLWHVRYGPVSHRRTFQDLMQGRAVTFLETYQRILDTVLPNLKSRLEPYTSGEIGLAYGVDDHGLYGYGLYPITSSTMHRITELHPNPDSGEDYRLAYWRLSVPTIRGSTRNFLNGDPMNHAAELVADLLQKAVKEGGLNETEIPTLVDETVLALVHETRKELGYPALATRIDWTRDLVPLDCTDALRRIYALSGTHWYIDEWIRSELQRDGPNVTRHENGGYSVSIPHEVERQAEVRAAREAAAGRSFPVYGTWKIQVLAISLQLALARQRTISTPVLPRPDLEPQPGERAFDAFYSDAQVQHFLGALFLSALEAYARLVEINFGALREKFYLYSQLPVGVVVDYRRAPEPHDSVNDWGRIDYAFVAGGETGNWAEVYVDRPEPAFRWKESGPPWLYARTRMGELSTVYGPILTSPLHIVFPYSAAPFGALSYGGSSDYAAVRAMTYHFLRSDLKQLSSTDLALALCAPHL